MYPVTAMQDPAAMVLGMAGLAHALYTTCSFVVLTFLDPASHAISNAMKHVVVIVSSTVLLGQSLSVSQGIGGVLAVSGVFLYNRAMAAEKAAGAASGSKSPGVSEHIRWFFESWPAVATALLVTLAVLVVLRN